jgi:hypothetical protein
MTPIQTMSLYHLSSTNRLLTPFSCLLNNSPDPTLVIPDPPPITPSVDQNLPPAPEPTPTTAPALTPIEDQILLPAFAPLNSPAPALEGPTAEAQIVECIKCLLVHHNVAYSLSWRLKEHENTIQRSGQ